MRARTHYIIPSSNLPLGLNPVYYRYRYMFALIFLFFSSILDKGGMKAQCDTEVSGIFTYCNSFNGSNPVAGYFVGFRVHDQTGANMNVVDLFGHNITNRGKRINDINTQGEPATISIQPLQIGGGADSLEYWYFGPYMNGDSFHIVLIPISGTCDTIFVGAGVFDCADMNNGNTDPFACSPPGGGLPVPMYYLDFSNSEFIIGGGGGGNENVDNIFLIMKRSRERTCCDVGGNSVSCIELIVTLADDDLGLIIDDVGSGSTGGEIFADTLHDFACTGDPTLTYPFHQEGGQSADEPLCLPPSLSRDYIILSCKPGSNATGLSIDVIENIEVPPVITQANCDAQINVLHVGDAIWFSPDDPNLDNLVTCTPDSTICTFHYNSDVFGEVVNCTGDTFVYIVGRSPMVGDCISSDTILYDTTSVIVYPELAVQINKACDVSGDSVILTALVTGAGIACGIDLLWSTGDTTSTIIVPVSNQVYSVTVSGLWMPEGLNACAISDVETGIGLVDVICNLPPDSIASCYNGLPPADVTQIEWMGCSETAIVFHVDVNNGGAGCINDTLIYSRHYIIDADGLMITTNDRDTCTQRFKFVDVISPVILACPPDVTISCNSSTAPASLGVATASDNCDPTPTITFSDSQISVLCQNSYVLQRTWQAADNCGNTARCLQRITVSDIIPPVITCPPNVTIACTASTLPANTGSATATDNCDTSPQITLTDVIISGSCPQSYTIQRRWIAADNCAHYDTCFQLITVVDNNFPTITCPPDITIIYPASTAPSNTGLATATDACSTPLITYQDSLIAGTCMLFPKIRRTWTASDGCGHAVPCIQYITVNDNGIICGHVEDDAGIGLSGILIQLWHDLNGNQVVDGLDTLESSTMTAGTTGQFCFTALRPCQYVLVEVQPATFGEESDYDHTPDPDGVDTLSGPNNSIPVILSSGELDHDNIFIDVRCALVLPVVPGDTICDGGTVVFQIPDPGIDQLNISWNFGSGSTPGSGSGLGPHFISYDTTSENQDTGTVIFITMTKAGCPTIEGVVTHVVVNPFPMADINGATTPLCYFTNRMFQPAAPEITGATYQWIFGNDAVPPSATGYGPQTVHYTAVGTKTVKLIIYPNDPGAQCPDSSSISFNVISCPGQILGYVKTTEEIPIINVNLKLYADQNADGVADNTTVVRNVFTNSIGSYSMASLIPGSYVIVETQPVGWVTANDFDASDDGDIVMNFDSLDNLIPVTILPGELDTMNMFREFPQPATIAGSVFIDNDGDLFPDAGEGLDSVLVSLFHDIDLDGHADTALIAASALTDVNGMFSIDNIMVGNYVLVETTPNEYLSLRDYDATNDGDAVQNSNLNNDTIPVTLSNGENDGQNYFIDAAICSGVVTSLNDSGYGTLRYNLSCAESGDTLTFHGSLAGQTISISSDPLLLNRDVHILSGLTPPIAIASSVGGLFFVPSNTTLELKNLVLISGLTNGEIGVAIDNAGNLLLDDVLIIKNPELAPGALLVWNRPGSTFEGRGVIHVKESP